METEHMSFKQLLAEKFTVIERENRTDLRWWMAAGTHTDETIKEELKAMCDGGFSGVELCQLADRTLDEKIYGYGSRQWEHDVKLILNTALDLGMSVSLTSGAGWSTANVPGLDPDCQMANQCVVLLTEEIAAGTGRSGPLPTWERLREKATLIGVVAVAKAGEKVYFPDDFVELTSLVSDGTLDWTAPADRDYTLMYYYAQGTAQAISPAAQPSYTINYFDRRGVAALKEYLMNNVLNDEDMIGKIKAGDVQFFMDSLEYNCGAGITSWTETFREEFKRRKGYDILPYLYLAKDAPNTSIWGWSNNGDLQGCYALTDREKNRTILNDIYDVQTKLYLEEFIDPFRAWLHSYGITLRVQISYGKNLEISEPIASVDYPEAENRNQNNQPDMYRLWSGGAHLQNKILSSETGGLDHSGYAYTYQRHLQEAYALYASGYSRIVWHIWAAPYGPKPVWPGYEGGDRKEIYYKFGTREPSCSDYPRFNDHLGRIQKLLRQGTAGVDLGMLYTKYGQHLVYRDAKDWLRDHEPMFFPSMVLQEHGYTYDYLSPTLLKGEGVHYNKETKTLEAAGYKALVLWQEDLSLAGAQTVLKLAREGLPVLLVEGAACRSPYCNEDAKTLASIVESLRELDNVVTVSCADKVLEGLQTLNIAPYLGVSQPNRQLLSQTRRVGENRYAFVYNYLQKDVEAELCADGIFRPYAIDPWTGALERIGFRHDRGRTFFTLALSAGDVALFALEKTDPAAQPAEVDQILMQTPEEITDWELTVESWTPSEEILTRTETLFGVTTEEYGVKTEKRKIHTLLKTLTTWDKIDAVGAHVSGKGYYRSAFHWDGTAEGAFLDFGALTQSMKVYINGKCTANVNLNHPWVDITSLLQKGKNVVEIEYSSNLNNLQLSRGAIREGVLPSDFLGYEVRYESYGPHRATLCPYCVKKV